jgi:hypothetical protein
MRSKQEAQSTRYEPRGVSVMDTDSLNATTGTSQRRILACGLCAIALLLSVGLCRP